MKRLAIILAVIVAVLAVAVAAAPFVIPADFLKQRVADRIGALAGRHVAFAGAPSLSIYPSLSISIDGLSVGNPKGMGSDPFIAAESVHTHLRLLPLFFGRAEFDEFELVKPTIHLVVDAEGRRNWDMARSAVAKQALAPPPTASDLVPPADIKIGHLLVSGGTVLYDDLNHNTREQMTDVDLDVMWPSVSATASGRGKLIWRGEPVEFTGLLAAPLQLFRGGTSAARFAVASTPVRVSFSGRATGAGGAHLYGDASISTPSLRRTIEWLGTPMGTGPILGAAAVRGMVSIGGPTVGFDAATVELDGNIAAGSLAVTLGGLRPSVRGALAFDNLDLSAYIEAIRADLIATGAWLIAPARMAFAEAVDADLRVSAGQVMMGAAEIGTTDATVAMHSGNLDVTVRQAEFYTGTIAGHAGIGRTGDTLVAAAQVQFSDVPAGMALADLAGTSALDGGAGGNIEIAAHGRNWGEIAHTVSGRGRLTIANGRLDGLDLPAMANALVDPFAGPVTPGSGSTQFGNLTAGLSIAEGEIGTDDLLMDGNGFRLALSGHGSLLSGAVAGRAILTDATESLPISVTGTWHEPTITRGRFGAPPG